VKKIMFIVFVVFSFMFSADASVTGQVACFENTTPLTVRNGVLGTKIGTLPCDTIVEITNTNAGNANQCLWYQIKFNDGIGYVCGNYIYNVVNNDDNQDNNQDNNNSSSNISLNGSLATPLCVENEDPLGVKSDLYGGTVTRLSCNDVFTIVDENYALVNGNYYHKIKYGNNLIGYISAKYTNPILTNTLSVAETEAYKSTLREKGFPESYLDYLVLLHAKYPNWEFQASITNLNFNDVIENEIGGKSLIYYTYGEEYRSKEEESYDALTDTYHRHPTETNWWYAGREAIAYYLDPRIYLNESYIYVFEVLSYDPLNHTRDSIVNMLSNSFLPKQDTNYADHIMNAASMYQISPIHLASRIIQEQGVDGSIASSGGEFTYNEILEDGSVKEHTYSGYYNLFNIGAYSSTTLNSPSVVGLVKARGGVNQTDTSYGKPWDSIEKSIRGGAQFLAESYISQGQDTLYYQKWDISPTSNTRYTHQYMQNITAPVTETLTTYQSYKKISNFFDQRLTFKIPVFNEGTLPSEISKHPVNTNSNNYLKEIKINGKLIDNFNSEVLEYNYIVNKNLMKVTIDASCISSSCNIDKLGIIELTEEERQQIKLSVTASNGSVRTYTINVIKIDDGTIIKPIDEILNNISVKFDDKYISGISVGTDILTLTNNINNYTSLNNTIVKISYKDINGNEKTTGSFKTGDKIIINNGVEEFIYDVLIYGDNDYDGEITILDLLVVKKIILNSISTNDLQNKASDVDRDGNITILDLLVLKKDILNTDKIVQ